MIQYPQKTSQTQVIERLKLSLYFLQIEKEKFESFTSCIKNTQLHQAMVIIIQENDHYSMEMKSIIQKLLGKFFLIESGDGIESNGEIENDIRNACEQGEKLLDKIYKDIFSESHLYDKLKKIISYS